MRDQLYFSIELARLLVADGLTLAEVQRRLKARNHKVSINQLSLLTRSKRRPSPRLINAAAKALELSKEQTRRLHRAAALDRGFDIGSL